VYATEGTLGIRRSTTIAARDPAASDRDHDLGGDSGASAATQYEGVSSELVLRGHTDWVYVTPERKRCESPKR